MKQSTVKVERGSRGFGLSLVYRGLDHFAQVAIFKKYLSNPEMQKALSLVNQVLCSRAEMMQIRSRWSKCSKSVRASSWES